MVEYVGLDVAKKETAYCVKDERGKTLACGKAASDPQAIFEALAEHCLLPERVVMETGTLSSWLAEGLGALGLAVEVIDARQAHAVMKLQHNKTDANDAALLAEIARTGFCRPVALKSLAARQDRAVLRARAQLVGQRRSLENTARSLLASFGHRLPKGSGKFARRVAAVLEAQPELAPAVAPLMTARRDLSRSLAELDREVLARAKASPACGLLMTVPGVGPVTALAFVATIDDPARFASSRSVGPYLGLTSRQWQTGETDYRGRISKHGDGLLRSLLYGAAFVFLTRAGRAHPLRDWARKIKKRSGHKKACVALARKLAVVLHKMLIRAEPFRWPQKDETAGKAAA